MTQKTHTLILDTSTERGVVAISSGDIIVAKQDLPFGNQSSRFLMQTLDDLFRSQHLSPQDLKSIAVGIGPGSYTGIRVGVIAAKTLSYANQIPLIGICSLTGFVPDADGDFAALIDAKIGGVYLILGKKSGRRVDFTQPSICSIDQLEEKLHGISMIVSPSLATLKPKILAVFPKSSWEWLERAPDPAQWALIAEELYKSGQFSLDGQLELLYLRQTQAEIEKRTPPSSHPTKNGPSF